MTLPPELEAQAREQFEAWDRVQEMRLLVAEGSLFQKEQAEEWLAIAWPVWQAGAQRTLGWAAKEATTTAGDKPDGMYEAGYMQGLVTFARRLRSLAGLEERDGK